MTKHHTHVVSSDQVPHEQARERSLLFFHHCGFDSRALRAMMDCYIETTTEPGLQLKLNVAFNLGSYFTRAIAEPGDVDPEVMFLQSALMQFIRDANELELLAVLQEAYQEKFQNESLERRTEED